MKALQHLNDLALQDARKRHPLVPPHALPKPRYKDKTANGLTKCVIDFIRLKGFQAERISTMGRLIDNRRTVTDVIGRQKVIGSSQWIKGSGTRGSADVSATLAGKSVKLEIKVGRDKQSQAQKEYQEQIERSGGIYLIVKSFEEFFQWYEEEMK